MKAKHDIPKLLRWNNDLYDLSIDLINSSFKILQNDHFGFMSIFFLEKQIEHNRSMVILINNNQHWDSTLIARSMIEGYSQLIWASKEKSERGYKWRAYSWITDWRKIKNQILSGDVVEQKQLTILNQSLSDIYQLFLIKKKQYIELKNGLTHITDPFFKNWFGDKYSISDIIKEDNNDVFLKLYGPFSAWHHWCPGGIGEAISNTDNILQFKNASPENAAASLAIGFKCLVETLEIVDEHFNLFKSDIINEFINNYIKDLGLQTIVWKPEAGLIRLNETELRF
ncbi:MAG: hypothetical protein EPN93_13895 [Spirochaetes bacterium]|nr:MAG: hypothetical protein EPN93_13895 [Spirochaetota bacterium]